MDKLAISVSEAARLCSIDKHLIYRLIEERRFPAVRAGKKKLIVPVDSLKQWLTKGPSND